MTTVATTGLEPSQKPEMPFTSFKCVVRTLEHKQGAMWEVEQSSMIWPHIGEPGVKGNKQTLWTTRWTLWVFIFTYTLCWSLCLQSSVQTLSIILSGYNMTWNSSVVHYYISQKIIFWQLKKLFKYYFCSGSKSRQCWLDVLQLTLGLKHIHFLGCL